MSEHFESMRTDTRPYRNIRRFLFVFLVLYLVVPTRSPLDIKVEDTENSKPKDGRH